MIAKDISTVRTHPNGLVAYIIGAPHALNLSGILSWVVDVNLL
jgi:hypothetical protein